MSPPRSSSQLALPDFEVAKHLLERYERSGPRYTSYPPAPHWSEGFDDAVYLDALRGAGQREGSWSLYVHIPFCEALCTYCACNRVITRDHAVAGPYLEGIEREAEQLVAALGAPRRHSQLALGGGTPTFLSAEELARLCDVVDAHFPPDPDAERSVEVDPRVTSAEQLGVLAERGFNRISLGVQDLAPRVQQAIRRLQPLEQTRRILEQARALGFGSVNFDLIYGLPFQTPASFSDTVDRVIELRPDRIALYSYAHVTWVSKQQRGFERHDLPGPQEKLTIFLHAIQRLTRSGYRFLGLDHFALPEDELSLAADAGTLQRNFMGYTARRSSDLLGLGASAISELAGAYAQSVRSPEVWQERLGSGRLATLRGWLLSDDDQRRSWLIQQLMCQGSIDPGAYAECFAEPLEERITDLPARLAPFVADGLLQPDAGGWTVTPLGRLFLRNIAMTFDAYLAPPGEVADEQPRYSRTV